MDNKLKFDSFMLCFDVTNYYPDYDVAFFLKQLEDWENGNIYIISYRALNNDVKSHYLDTKYVWLDRIGLSFLELEKTIKKLGKQDIVVVIGGERLSHLLPDSSIASVEFGEKQSNLHLQTDEDWDTFARDLDKIYYDVQSVVAGLIFICNVNEEIVKKVNFILKDSNNMSIMQSEGIGGDDEKRIYTDAMFRLMKDQPLEKCLEIINNNAERISAEQIQMCKAVAYFNNGNITTSIDILKKNYSYLSNEQKGFLADLYILKNDVISAQKIFEELYLSDCQQKGLYELGLRAYPEDSERYEQILLEGIKYQPESPAVIECYANWLSFHEQFEEAAKWFRKINMPYHNLVAKVNDLLAEKQTDLHIVKAYLFDLVESNPELKNEAILRIGLYALKDGHFFDAYNIFKEADIEHVSETVKKILLGKINILADTAKASKALRKIKPYSKQSDWKLLVLERCKVLHQAIHVFSYDVEGFYSWRELLNCQQLDAWSRGIKKYILDILKKISELDIEKILTKSYVHNLKINDKELDCDTAIFCLRKSNCGEMPLEKFGCTRDEIVKGSYAIGNQFGTITQKIWIIYYCSIGASILNENPQDANGFSLHIPELASSNKCNQDLYSALYLMSWGNSQFRLGNHIEGMACVNVAIEKFLSVNEIVPILEEGGNILSKFLITYENVFSDEEKKTISQCLEKLLDYNETFLPVYKKFSDNLSDLISGYKEKVEKGEKNANWLVDLSNLIQILVQNNNGEDATEYIKENYQDAEKLLVQRRDIAAQMLYSWGKIVIMNTASGENYLLALELMDRAIKQIQSRRKVYHQEERAALAEEYDLILRDYLCFAGAYYSAKDLNIEVKEKLKVSILEKMSICLPLSIIEQKYYFKYKEISEDMEAKHREIKALKKEYGIMLQRNSKSTEEVEIIAKKIETLTEELVAKHPYYKSLEQYLGTNWEEIQEVLTENEVVYQYVLTNLTVISILVTKNWIDIHTKMLDLSYDSPISGMKKYGVIVENSTIKTGKVDEYSEAISKLVAEHLCEYVYNYDINSVYVLPDVSKSIFPLAAAKYKGEYLIDKVQEIINFIDYKQLIEYIRKPRKISKIVNRLFGKPSDRSISKIKKWLLAYERDDFINIVEENDDMGILRKKLENEKADTVAIYGHGVRNPDSNSVEGAQSIEGIKGMIHMRNILDNIVTDNLVIISCVGGTPNNINPEVSSGTWSSVFERFNGIIISCKWSVPTEDTIELISQMYNHTLDEGMNISEALLTAQRYMKNRGKGELSWAGVECWIN